MSGQTSLDAAHPLEDGTYRVHLHDPSRGCGESTDALRRDLDVCVRITGHGVTTQVYDPAGTLLAETEMELWQGDINSHVWDLQHSLSMQGEPLNSARLLAYDDIWMPDGSRVTHAEPQEAIMEAPVQEELP